MLATRGLGLNKNNYFNSFLYNINNLSPPTLLSTIRTLTTKATTSSMSNHPLVGEPVPKDLVLNNQDGKSIELNSYIGNQKPCIIFFYPRDESYGCTREVCSFRDSYAEFSDAGATVFGISSDSVENHQKFAKNQKLQFDLLSDPNGKVREAFKVPKTLGVLSGRATFLIDKSGIIKDVYNSQLDFQGHSKKSIEFIKNQAT